MKHRFVVEFEIKDRALGTARDRMKQILRGGIISAQVGSDVLEPHDGPIVYLPYAQDTQWGTLPMSKEMMERVEEQLRAAGMLAEK